jgi:hypothetical protein
MTPSKTPHFERDLWTYWMKEKQALALFSAAGSETP